MASKYKIESPITYGAIIVGFALLLALLSIQTLLGYLVIVAVNALFFLIQPAVQVLFGSERARTRFLLLSIGACFVGGFFLSTAIFHQGNALLLLATSTIIPFMWMRIIALRNKQRMFAILGDTFLGFYNPEVAQTLRVEAYSSIQTESLLESSVYELLERYSSDSPYAIASLVRGAARMQIAGTPEGGYLIFATTNVNKRNCWVSIVDGNLLDDEEMTSFQYGANTPAAPFPSRNIVPIDAVHAVVPEFINSGTLRSDIAWEIKKGGLPYGISRDPYPFTSL